ncbi:MAG: hypothetical protein JW737_00220 [Acidobacteria bacterium]|nr:hypothetical protein [Acidobacteriota bacterium]
MTDKKPVYNIEKIIVFIIQYGKAIGLTTFYLVVGLVSIFIFHFGVLNGILVLVILILITFLYFRRRSDEDKGLASVMNKFYYTKKQKTKKEKKMAKKKNKKVNLQELK